ncbi:MAG TPA: CaiB/BaiF CoA-transferase family protein [Steroidobacter sp.]|jgi:alpha-methylacyl-CoA racemase|nr:CaiB/BaiF CoA-transferase family protein [Steroidobacteraceae bacterium]HLS79917.1 CaiB/BaiF CoA-transferase family protein [Steroidobacter sp.]
MGPLRGFKVIELAGIGPCPMAGMMLADLGAEVIRIERSVHTQPELRRDVSFRGKKSVAIDLKKPAGVQVLLRLIEGAEALIEGYRPGVMERLGLGPDVCLERNPKLVYGRMTGWGQDGPLAQAPGHDINYIALTGALHAMGPRDQAPVPPLNLVGDMGGGGMLLAYGVVCALLEAQRSGLGQVVDAAMVDGAAQLMWMIHGFHAGGLWNAEQRGGNLLDGGAHFYGVYETADGKYVCVGAIEPQFYAKLLEATGVDRSRFADPTDPAKWPSCKAELAAVFKSKTRAQWCEIMEGSDACFAPVLSLTEAPEHPHNQARGTYMVVDDIVQPAPAPRFSRTPAQVRDGRRPAGADGEAVLRAAGYTDEEIARLGREGVLMCA